MNHWIFDVLHNAPKKQPDGAMCRFDDGNYAVGRFAFSDGCVCYPDDKEQDLCIQHVVKSTPLGSFECLHSYG